LILVDFSQVVISAITAGIYGKNDVNASEIDPGYIRHMVINMIRSYRQKFGREYGELVFCIDSGDCWRKDKFPYYKANRKKDRESSTIDWKMIFDTIKTIRDELSEYFPYPVIKVDRCEADDIIAVLCKWSQTNDLTTVGIFQDEPKPILILSSDGDAIQLQRYKNVQQYAPITKKWLTLPAGMNADQFLIEHIIEGDTGDGVPNVLSADNCLADKIRQKSLRKERREEFMQNGINACKDDTEIANWHRNQLLVDANMIPQQYADKIIHVFTAEKEAAEKRGRKRVMSYLIKNKMRLLIDNLNEF